jgi:hypothetical protein
MQWVECRIIMLPDLQAAPASSASVKKRFSMVFALAMEGFASHLGLSAGKPGGGMSDVDSPEVGQPTSARTTRLLRLAARYCTLHVPRGQKAS